MYGVVWHGIKLLGLIVMRDSCSEQKKEEGCLVILTCHVMIYNSK